MITVLYSHIILPISQIILIIIKWEKNKLELFTFQFQNRKPFQRILFSLLQNAMKYILEKTFKNQISLPFFRNMQRDKNHNMNYSNHIVEKKRKRTTSGQLKMTVTRKRNGEGICFGVCTRERKQWSCLIRSVVAWL